MTRDDAKKQRDGKIVAPSHPAGVRPTTDDAESRMTSEGDVQNMDESQAGRMGEGLRGEKQVRHESPAKGNTGPGGSLEDEVHTARLQRMMKSGT
jgi:hypothetical protein